MKSSLVAAVAALMITSGAYAQEQEGGAPAGPLPGGGFEQACGTDVQNLCPSAQSGRDRHMCLRQNQDKLSPTCSSFLASHHGHHMHQGEQMQGQPASQGPAPSQGEAAPPQD